MSSKDQKELMYHSFDHDEEPGYWTDKSERVREITLKDGDKITESPVPTGFKKSKGKLYMEISTYEGDVYIPIDLFQGLNVVKGDSKSHPYEKDGELLIEFTYFKGDKMDTKPRRIRPVGIKVGIKGDTEKESFEKAIGHRALGESVDSYIEGYDTQYDPGENGNAGFRSFPFWRMGIYGDSLKVKKDFIPEEQGSGK